jgi:hypothetical protein
MILLFGLLGSLVLLLPQSRQFACNLIEQSVLHRELRNSDKWKNKLLEYALISSGLILTIGFCLLTKPGRKLVNKTEPEGGNSWKVDIHILKTFLYSEIFFAAFVVFTGMAVFLIALFRAANTSITWDEALTYQYYVLPSIFDSFIKNQMLNNHLLNSFCIRMIMFLSQSRYNELLIRFPNLIFYCIYIIFAYKIAKRQKNKYFVFILFISNYYLNEFFGLARGYGMACACMTGVCYFFEKWKSVYISKENDNKSFLLFLFFCLLAALSNSITLYISLGFLILINFKYKKDILTLPNLFVYIVLFLIGLHSVNYSNRGGESVYSTHSLYSAVMSIPIMFSDSIYLTILIALVFFLSFCWVIIKTKVRDDYCLLLVIFIIVCIVSQLVFRRGYPVMREMLPFYPVFVLIVVDALKYFSNYKITKPILAICTLLLCFQFVLKINTKSTKDWNDNYSIRDNIYNYIGSHDVLNGNEEFMDFIKISQKQFNGNPVFIFYAEKTKYLLKNKIGE